MLFNCINKINMIYLYIDKNIDKIKGGVMKKILFFIFFITLFFLAPNIVKGANVCVGTCTYYIPNCGVNIPGFLGYSGNGDNKTYEAYTFDECTMGDCIYTEYFLNNETAGYSYDQITTAHDSTGIPIKRIWGRYFIFSISKDFESVAYEQQQWDNSDEEGNNVMPYKLAAPYFSIPINDNLFSKQEFLNNTCQCPRIYIKNYCSDDWGDNNYTGGPVVLGKDIPNQTSTYNEMTLIKKESKLAYVEADTPTSNPVIDPSKDIQSESYSTKDVTIYSHGADYDLNWHLTITKKHEKNEVFLGEFVATKNYHGSGQRYEKKTTSLGLTKISSDDLDNLSNFVENVTISDTQLKACIDRALYPEKYENTQANEYSPKCFLQYKVKGSNSNRELVINSSSIRIINTEGQPIQCSDFDLDNGENLVQMLFTIIKIIAPVLVIVFGSLDFAKAIFQADEDKQKKASKDFAKRLAAAALIFLIPTILETILGIAFNWDEVIPSVCIK